MGRLWQDQVATPQPQPDVAQFRQNLQDLQDSLVALQSLPPRLSNIISMRIVQQQSSHSGIPVEELAEGLADIAVELDDDQSSDDEGVQAGGSAGQQQRNEGAAMQRVQRPVWRNLQPVVLHGMGAEQATLVRGLYSRSMPGTFANVLAQAYNQSGTAKETRAVQQIRKCASPVGNVV